MSLKDKIYIKSPYVVKQILLNIVGYQFKRRRRTKGYFQFVEQYNSQWFSSLEELNKIQKKELQALLSEAFKFSTFYRKHFEDAGVTKVDISENPYQVLNKLPFLSKADRRSFADEIMNKNPERPLVEVGYTSGTSGSPTKNYLDQESIDRGFALWSRFHDQIGIKRGSKNVRFSGRLIVKPDANKAPFWIKNWSENQLLMSTYHLKNENIPFYIQKLNKFQPDFLDGYPSAFYIIASFIIKNGIKLSFSPKAIITTAETLYDYQKITIEKAFGCRVYNQYASSEGSPFITECHEGKLHINMDSGYFEFFNNKNLKAEPGEVARLVVTSFRNLKTPLIRYDILDSVITAKDNTPCNCGCNMPYVERIIGREDDILWTKEKGYVGRMDTAYKGLTGIVQSQIIQINESDFIVNSVVDEDYTPTIENEIAQNLKDRLGASINIQFVYVDKISLGKNGKFKAVERRFKIN